MKTRDLKVTPDMVGRMQLRGQAMIADNAVVVGDVRLHKDVNIWFGVTMRGDDSWIEIGEGTNVQDNTCVHIDPEVPNRIGRMVTIGHCAVVHGAEIGDHCLIGMGAILLGGSVIGEERRVLDHRRRRPGPRERRDSAPLGRAGGAGEGAPADHGGGIRGPRVAAAALHCAGEELSGAGVRARALEEFAIGAHGHRD
jgi:UDP-3-O-[3-hydroxymyristoyl] glucosamine N-acyltransferase